MELRTKKDWDEVLAVIDFRQEIKLHVAGYEVSLKYMWAKRRMKCIITVEVNGTMETQWFSSPYTQEALLFFPQKEKSMFKPKDVEVFKRLSIKDRKELLGKLGITYNPKKNVASQIPKKKIFKLAWESWSALVSHYVELSKRGYRVMWEKPLAPTGLTSLFKTLDISDEMDVVLTELY